MILKVLTALSAKLVQEVKWRTNLVELAKMKTRAAEEHSFSVPKCKQKIV